MKKMLVAVVFMVSCLVPSFVLAASAPELQRAVENALVSAGYSAKVDKPTQSTQETYGVYISLQVSSAETAKEEAVEAMESLFANGFPEIDTCTMMTYIGRTPNGALIYTPEDESYSWAYKGIVEKF